MPDLDLVTHQLSKCVAFIRRRAFTLGILFLAEVKYLNMLFKSKWHVLIYNDHGPPEEKVIYLLQNHFSLV